MIDTNLSYRAAAGGNLGHGSVNGDTLPLLGSRASLAHSVHLPLTGALALIGGKKNTPRAETTAVISQSELYFQKKIRRENNPEKSILNYWDSAVLTAVFIL